jgi:hypothetical protein
MIAFNHKFLKSGNEEEEEEANVLKKLRDLCSLFNSNQKNEILLKVQSELEEYHGDTPLTMVNDVKTRWWSTYNMVQRALYLRKALEKMEFDGTLKASEDKRNTSSHLLTPREWTVMEQLACLLKPFKLTQQTLEGVDYVTSSLVHFTIDVLMHELASFDIDDENEDIDESLRSSILECAQQMGEDLNVRWGDPQFPWNQGTVKRGQARRQVGFHPNYILATALDPRFKDLNAIDESQHEDLKSYLVKEMVKARVQQHVIFSAQRKDKDTKKVSTISKAINEQKQTKRRSITDKSDAGVFARYAQLQSANKNRASSVDAHINNTINETELRLESKQELERYFSSPGLDIVKHDDPSQLEDPLSWWAMKKKAYPHVWTLAKFYLGIPATSANSERSFSFANRLLNSSRTRMGATLVEDTFFVHRNFELLPQSPNAEKTKKRKASAISDDEIITID